MVPSVTLGARRPHVPAVEAGTELTDDLFRDLRGRYNTESL